MSGNLQPDDSSFLRQTLQDQAFEVTAASCAPSVLYRPKVYRDGDQWCALYGEDIQMGVAGFGDSPAAACAEFDVVWSTGALPARKDVDR